MFTLRFLLFLLKFLIFTITCEYRSDLSVRAFIIHPCAFPSINDLKNR